MRKAMWTLLAAALVLGGCGLARDEHGYPEAVKANFLEACTKTGTSSVSCNCALARIEARVPYDRFSAEEERLNAGKAMSPDFEQTLTKDMRECATAK